MVLLDINKICIQAHHAFDVYHNINFQKRYDFLHLIAKKLLQQKDIIIQQAHQDTYLSIADLTHEFERMIFQIHNYSHTLLTPSASHTDLNNLTLDYKPLGSVVVFGASNFPFAYSTSGGDVISALVAGCSVIFKAHEAHLRTSCLVHNIIQEAILESGMPLHIYQHLDNISHDEAGLLIQHPLIKAVGFTGSIAVGRKLFNLCQARPEPIPFFGELGSVNPVFVCHNSFHKYHKDIAKNYSHSFSMRGGQVCTNPAILVIPQTDMTAEFYTLLHDFLSTIPPQKMLTEIIFDKFKQGYNYLKTHYQQIGRINPIDNDNHIKPVLFTVSPNEWLNDIVLHNEIFGAIGIVITYNTKQELYDIAHSFSGQLTASIHGTESDKSDMVLLENIMSQKVGRLIYNEYPTGVRVDYHMHHGGVYPASTCSQFTAVGERAVTRFLRPICYQNKPEFLITKISI